MTAIGAVVLLFSLRARLKESAHDHRASHGERGALVGAGAALSGAAPEGRGSGSGGPWKTTTWLARCLGFVLGVVGTGMFAGMLVSFPSPWLLGGLVMVIVAEWLVAQRRVIHSGVEEIVYLCGAISIVVQILLWNRSGGHEEVGVALIAAAALLVGWRLMNPITTLAAALLSLAVAMKAGICSVAACGDAFGLLRGVGRAPYQQWLAVVAAFTDRMLTGWSS
jgi:hypothetical protein